jgi:hypothetical protein
LFCRSSAIDVVGICSQPLSILLCSQTHFRQRASPAPTNRQGALKSGDPPSRRTNITPDSTDFNRSQCCGVKWARVRWATSGGGYVSGHAIKYLPTRWSDSWLGRTQDPSPRAAPGPAPA